MRKILFAVAFAILANTQAFAIIGIGAHYVMNTGSLDAKSSSADIINGLGSVEVNQKKADGLQGLGFKAWVDFLPYVDIEGTLNIAATRYEASLKVNTPVGSDSIDLKYTPDAPYSLIFGTANPLYGVVNGDLSITYPFTKLPIIRPYIGAGISYFASIPVINASFAQKMLNNMLDKNPNKDLSDTKEIGKSLIDALEDESYTTGIGGHIIAGLRIKPPIIPLAIYANGKYYFGGNTNSQFSQGFVLEVGGGFAL